MGELIFFAVIILFSILESIARGRKKKGGLPIPGPGEWEPDSEDWEEQELPLEAESSHRDLRNRGERDSGTTLPGHPRPAGAERVRTVAGSSEGMIPAEIWEEIAGLARGQGTAASTRSAPRPPAPPPTRVEEVRPVKHTRSSPIIPAPTHRVHLAHADYGTDPSGRAASEQDGLDPLAGRLSADAAQVRRVLSSGRGPHALRQAIILHEVLGPPAALRDE